VSKLVRIAVIVVTGLLLASCMTLRASNYRTFDAIGPASGEYRDLPIASGQVVISSSSSPLDMALALMPANFSPYIHLGILVIDEGVPYVYESIGNPSLNFEPEIPPTATIKGNVNRVPLVQFIARYFYVEIYDPVGVDRQKMTAFARWHLAAKTPFDRYFDYQDDTAFYCAEFVARGLENAGHPRFKPVANRANASFSTVMEWLGVPEETLPISALVAGSQRVLRVSNHREVEILLLDAIKGELYRRFTADQRLGNLFRWDINRPQLRFPGQLFVKRSMALSSTVPADPDKATLAVRQVADQLFGPFDSSAD